MSKHMMIAVCPYCGAGEVYDDNDPESARAAEAHRMHHKCGEPYAINAIELMNMWGLDMTAEAKGACLDEYNDYKNIVIRR